jgi:hypothetical protein
MIQTDLDGTRHDVAPTQLTALQLQDKLKNDAEYSLFSCGQDRTATTIENISISHIKEWGREWYVIHNRDSDESITALNIIDTTRLLNELLWEG